MCYTGKCKYETAYGECTLEENLNCWFDDLSELFLKEEEEKEGDKE